MYRPYVKQLYTANDIFTRVDEVMRLAIRLFGDVDEAAGLNALEALLRIREKYSPLMKVEAVAFPQDGVLNQTTQGLMRQAVQFQPEKRFVILRGKLAAQSRQESELFI